MLRISNTMSFFGTKVEAAASVCDLLAVTVFLLEVPGGQVKEK